MVEKGKIVIIDDKLTDALFIKDEILKYLPNEEIFIFTNFNKEFLTNNKIDLLLLDVELDEQNGIKELEKLQKEQNHKMNVIIVSYKDDFIFDSFLVKPVCFCRKSYLNQDINRAFKNLEATHFRREIAINDEMIRMNDVVYLESHFHNVLIHLKNKEIIQTRKKLSDYEKELDSFHFARCHQSFIVNCEYVDQYKEIVILKTGIKLPISRKYEKTFNKSFLHYIIDTH